MDEYRCSKDAMRGCPYSKSCDGTYLGLNSECGKYNAKCLPPTVRQELKAYRATGLTLEHGFDITNADGTPIDYDALGRKYKDKLCYCDIDGFYIGQDGKLVLMDDCGASVLVDRGDYHIEARKPEEGK